MTTLPTASDLPESLVEYDHWVCWREESRGDKPTKIPVNPHTGRYASTTDEETWGSFETAREYAVDGSAEGLGFVFCDADPFVGVDLDDARDPDDGTPTAWAKSIIDELNSYTEVSPSGTGYHVLIEGDLPPGRNRRGDVELYETARFFTVTAAHVERTPTEIIERTTALAGVYDDHVADEDADANDSVDGERSPTSDDARDADTAGTSDDDTPSSDASLADETLLSKARAASNSAKFERLWRGDTSGYDSHSEADMALACLLAFWTGGARRQMDRLFRRSGLMRDKWDAVHYADGSTYGEKTVERACRATTEYYSPSDERQQSGDESSGTDGRVSVDASRTAAPAVGDPTSADGDTAYEREKARIETIQTLEDRLRELEAENERLRDERDAERAKRKALEADESASDSESIGIVDFLRRLFE